MIDNDWNDDRVCEVHDFIFLLIVYKLNIFILQIIANWEPTPSYFNKIDMRGLLQDDAIDDVCICYNNYIHYNFNNNIEQICFQYLSIAEYRHS